jgi:hypothetical protein
MKNSLNLIISTERGYPTVYDGKRHYVITFSTKEIRDAIEPELSKMKTGLTYSLPEGYFFKLTEGLDRIVAKVCKVKKKEESQDDLWNEAIQLLDIVTFQNRAVEMLTEKFTITRK